MPVSIRIDPETGIAIATCSGALRLSEAREAATALWGAPGWPGRSAVWDFRAAELNFSSSDAWEIAQFVLQHQPTPPPAKMAFVTQRDVDFGLSRMFGAFREDPRTEVIVYRDYHDAISWARSLESGDAQ